MPVRFTILASGSSGNCAYLECGETRLLIDAGLSALQIRRRLASIGRSAEGLSGVLVTHEHVDHIGGLGVLCEKLGIPVYANRLTADAAGRISGKKLAWRVFETGAAFEVGSVGVQSFAVPHDAMDPVGFAIVAGGRRIGFLTDLGHVTKLVMERVRQSEVLVLEANHDPHLLQEDTRRPWSTKQRILSRHGHLSNAAAADVAAELAPHGVSTIYLGHLSRDCNRPDLARSVVSARLREVGAAHVRIEDTSPDEPCATLELPEA
jgi:phosphoribosyl 1,2-cyclic phosphodiesterase